MEQERQEENQKLTKKISPYKIIYPIIIGLAVVSYMLYKEFDPKAFDMITFTWNTVFWLFIAVLCMAIRDLGYIIRIKILSGGKLTWIQSIRVIFLWEFTSAVTPSAIGGTSLAILFVHKEGIGVGKSSAMVMATSFLDELYFHHHVSTHIAVCQPPGTVGNAGHYESRGRRVNSRRHHWILRETCLPARVKLRVIQEPTGLEMADHEIIPVANSP